MRNLFIAVVFVAALLLASFASGPLTGVEDAWAVKPPTVREREASVSNPDQHRKAAWFGRKSRTTGGTFCKCGVSKTSDKRCYYPKEGQYCCNPETGDCHIVKIEDWNNPVRAFEGR